MRRILVYGDSLSWGIIPGSRERFAFSRRWPGVLENALDASGRTVRVIENCLNGRKTVWDDPFKGGRNGAQSLSATVEAQSPLDLVIIALGTNDFQDTHDNHAWASAQGIATLIDIVRQAPMEPGMPEPAILVLAPPAIVNPQGLIAAKFRGAETRCAGHVEAFRAVAEQKSVLFFDMNTVTTASRVDGIHLDEDQHAMVGNGLAPLVRNVMDGEVRE